MQHIVERWWYVFILIMLVGPIDYTNVNGSTSQEGDSGSFNIVQTTIITIISSVAALFFANYLLDLKRHRQTRPTLKINPDENPSTYEHDVPMPMYNITPMTSILVPGLAKLIGLNLNYKINRIKVRNSGNTAAEDCKGIIIQNDIEMKICWNVPDERHKMTINAKSYEYLDICAVLIGDRTKIINFSLDDSCHQRLFALITEFIIKMNIYLIRKRIPISNILLVGNIRQHNPLCFP